MRLWVGAAPQTRVRYVRYIDMAERPDVAAFEAQGFTVRQKGRVWKLMTFDPALAVAHGCIKTERVALDASDRLSL